MSDAAFRNMPVWQNSFEYSLAIHRLVGSLPEADRPVAARDLNAAAVRIPVGLARASVTGKADFISALEAAYQDCAEIQTLLDVLSALYPQSNLDELQDGATHLSANLMSVRRRLSTTKPAAKTV